PVGVLAVGGPGLLAVDEEVIALVLGGGAERGEVGAGVGLGVALTPRDRANDDAREEALLLLVGAEADDERTDHVEAEGRELRGAGERELLGEDEAARGVELRAAHALREVRRRPALLVEDAVPLHHLGVGEGGAALG